MICYQIQQFEVYCVLVQESLRDEIIIKYTNIYGSMLSVLGLLQRGIIQRAHQMHDDQSIRAERRIRHVVQ